jgi:hypothetical protein
MKKNGSSYIKLGLERDHFSGELTLNIQFDNNAPNFSKDKDVISWCPSIEEWNFANEAFQILSKGQNYKHGKTSNLEKKETDHEEDFILQADEHEIVDKYLEKNKKV